MKKYLVLLITVICSALMFGCTYDNQILDKNKYTVVCTNFAGYDWTMNVIGEKSNLYDVKLITDSGTDIHSYQPTTFDIAIINECDILVCTGGESEGWVLDAAKGYDDKVVNMMELLKDVIREEEIVEGMEAEDDEHDEGSEESHDNEVLESDHEHEHHEEEPEYDEHVWLSLNNAQLVVNGICEKVSELDSKNADYYERSAAAYNVRLSDLNDKYENVVANASGDTLVFGDRFPFRYLTDDYDLNYYAAFVGCSTESDAAFDTIVFLMEKIREYGMDCVIAIEKSDCSVAKSVVNVTSDKALKILELNSMQSVTRRQIDEGFTYLGAMESNLAVLEEALNY